MAERKSVLRSIMTGCALWGLSAGWAYAQESGPVQQVTSPLPETTRFDGPELAGLLEYTPVGDDPYFQRVATLIAEIQTNLALSAHGTPDDLAGNIPGVAEFVLADAPFPYTARCGVEPAIADSASRPYLMLPSGWKGRSLSILPGKYREDATIFVAAALGSARSAHVCADTFPNRSLVGTPYQATMTDAGLIEGLAGLPAVAGLDGLRERGLSRYTGLLRQIVEERKSGAIGEDEFDGLRLQFLDRKALTTPFLGTRDLTKFLFLRGLGYDLEKLFETGPADPGDALAVLDWLQSSVVDSSGEPLDLGKFLAVMDYHSAVATNFHGDSPRDRKIWQKGRNGIDDEGCRDVQLALDSPYRDIEFALKPAASYCVTLSWSDAAPDPELPPQLTVLARAKDGQADSAAALQLGAAQSFASERQGSGEDEQPDALWLSAYRHGIVLENPKSGTGVKNWEIVFKPDSTYNDDRMTLVFTNLNREAIGATKETTFTVTIGEGVHTADADLKVTSFRKEDDTCKVPQSIAPPLPAGPMTLVEAGRTLYGNDGLGFDKSPTFGGKFVLGAADPRLCSRILSALSAGGLEENIGDMLGMSPVSQKVASNAPQTICKARMAKLMSAISGTGVDDRFELEFEVTPRERLKGPGSYPADFSLTYTQPILARRGLIEPSYADGTGTVTVVSQTETHLHLRYDVTLQDQGETCDARIEGHIAGEIMTPYALPSEEDLIAYALHPRDILGDDIWRQIPESDRAEMIAEWRAEPTSVIRDSGDSSATPARAESGMAADCVVTPQDIETIIDTQLAMLPEETRATYAPIYEELRRPDYPKEVLCVLKEELLGGK